MAGDEIFDVLEDGGNIFDRLGNAVSKFSRRPIAHNAAIMMDKLMPTSLTKLALAGSNLAMRKSVGCTVGILGACQALMNMGKGMGKRCTVGRGE